MHYAKLKIDINEARNIIAAGIPISNTTLVDGTYPFDRIVQITPTGRRTFEIFRVDLLA